MSGPVRERTKKGEGVKGTACTGGYKGPQVIFTNHSFLCPTAPHGGGGNSVLLIIQLVNINFNTRAGRNVC